MVEARGAKSKSERRHVGGKKKIRRNEKKKITSTDKKEKKNKNRKGQKTRRESMFLHGGGGCQSCPPTPSPSPPPRARLSAVCHRRRLGATLSRSLFIPFPLLIHLFPLFSLPLPHPLFHNCKDEKKKKKKKLGEKK